MRRRCCEWRLRFRGDPSSSTFTPHPTQKPAIICAMCRLVLLLLFASVLAPGQLNAQGLPTKKPLVKSTLGVNAFVNDQQFGSIKSQLKEVRKKLKLKRVRFLFAWTDAVQPTRNSTPNFSFYDDIVAAIPKGVKAMVVLSSLPSWMSDSSNWIDNDPRKTFVELWVRKVAERYANKARVVGWQIWNEPNADISDNDTLQVENSPANYADMLQMGFNAVREEAPADLVISAATTAINQNWPETLDYAQDLKDAGLESYCDVVGVHVYGTHYEVFLLGGVEDYLNSIDKPIWVTESGKQGLNKQLSYATKMWPWLLELVPGIKYIYQYQFTEDTPSSSTFGMRNLSGYSDLYTYLKHQ